MTYTETDNVEQLKKVMNRLRAQLLGIIEQLGLDPAQTAAVKRAVKDRTSEAWTDITNIFIK